MARALSCVSLPAMKLSKTLLLIVSIGLVAYTFSVWLNFDDRLSSYAISNEKKFRISAEQGDAKAQYQLGLMYDRSIGVEGDAGEALKWYRLAAEQSYAKAQYNLGMMYYFGKAVPQDRVMGYQWILLAADRGEQAAKDAATELAKKISIKQEKRAKAGALTWNEAHKKQIPPATSSEGKNDPS